MASKKFIPMLMAVVLCSAGFNAMVTGQIRCAVCDTRDSSLPCYGPGIQITNCSAGEWCQLHKVLDETCPEERIWYYTSGCIHKTHVSSARCSGRYSSCCNTETHTLCNRDWFNFSENATNIPRLCSVRRGPTTVTLRNSTSNPATVASPTTGTSQRTAMPSKGIDSTLLRVAIACSAVLVCAILMVLLLRCHPPLKRCVGESVDKLLLKLGLKIRLGGFTTDSDSANPPPPQQQVTVSREIELSEQIGSGRFADLHRGSWRGQQVVVKIFRPTCEAQFFRELEMFGTYMLRHDSIVAFHAADRQTGGEGADAQLWLVMEYHAGGSLRDYLTGRYGDGGGGAVAAEDAAADMRRLYLSMAAGLVHLHSHVQGQYYGCKPSIAHRNLHSKNVLVRQDGSCCLSDLAMAIQQQGDDSAASVLYVEKSELKLGVPRYMAPEVLSGSIDCTSFEDFRKADVYSLALIMWEVATACLPAEGRPAECTLPFAERVPDSPSIDNMLEAVCTAEDRPALPEHWKTDEDLNVVHRIIRTSWKKKPASRFASNRIWRNLQEMHVPCYDKAATLSQHVSILLPLQDTESEV